MNMNKISKVLFACTLVMGVAGCQKKTATQSSELKDDYGDDSPILGTAARGVVTCIEANNGKLTQKDFDETGECASGPNIWSDPTDNNTIVSRMTFVRTFPGDRYAGRYYGTVRFELIDQKKVCGFDLFANYSGEDIQVEVKSALNCQEKKDLTSERKFTVSSIECGEVDPYTIGDACILEVECHNRDVWKLVGDFDKIMSVYSHETLASLAGRHVGINLDGLQQMVEPSALATIAGIDTTDNIFWWVSSEWILVGDPARTPTDFSQVTYTNGSDGKKSKTELEEFEHTTELSDRQLVDLVWSGKSADEHSMTQMQQLELAREAIIGADGAYGEALANSDYLDDHLTSWQALEMFDPDTKQSIDVVAFNEMDDGSYSVMFKAGTTEILYVYYEN